MRPLDLEDHAFEADCTIVFCVVFIRNARIEDSRIKGDMIDHPSFGNMNRRTSRVINRTRHGNLHRFETDNTIYNINNEDLEDEVVRDKPFWGNE